MKAQKHLIIVASVLALSLLAGCGRKPQPSQAASPTNVDSQIGEENSRIVLAANVVGCAESSQTMPTRSTPSDDEQDPRVFVVGTTVRYSRALHHQCCRTVAFHHQIDAGEIKVVEHWTGQGCRCVCSSSLEVTLNNIPPSNYTFTVVEAGIASGTNESLPEVLVHSEIIQIRDNDEGG